MSACPSSQHVIRTNLPFPSLGPPCESLPAGSSASIGHRPNTGTSVGTPPPERPSDSPLGTTHGIALLELPPRSCPLGLPLGPPRRATCGIRFSVGYRHAKRHAPAGALPFGPGRRTGGAGRIPATLLSPGNLRPSIESFATPHISGSYRLRRHFPRHCDVSTRIPYPYQLRFLRPEGPRDRLRAPCPRPAQAANPRNAELVVRRSQRAGHTPPLCESCYQLAFVTPGIRPFEAISRNWIRLMPNRRM